MSGVDASWCRYFFVYDTSQVTGEDDSTDKGIRYFYPPETDEDEQRLLCSQFPGVARCVAEITCRPPFMLHLRHVKFALRTQGPFFLALGCITSLPDGCCRHMLDRLLVLFTCYRGPLRLAYQQGSGPPWPIWEPFLDHVQRAVRYLPGLFSTVRYLNKREVDPLLLLKAALILQSCQRCPHVLAGCILHNLTVVSSQLTPQVTAHLLAARNVHRALKDLSQYSSGDTAFDREASVIPVYLSDEEFSSLHCHSARRLNRFSSTGSDLVSRTCGADGRPRLSVTLSDTTDTESDNSSSDEGSSGSKCTRRRVPGCGALLFQPLLADNLGSPLGRWKADLTNAVSEFQASEASVTTADTLESISEAEEAATSTNARARTRGDQGPATPGGHDGATSHEEGKALGTLGWHKSSGVVAGVVFHRDATGHEEERSNKEVGSSEGGVSGEVAPSIETRRGGQPQCSDEVSGVMPSEGRQHLDSDAPMLLDSAETSPELQPLTSHNRSSGRGAAASIGSRAGAAGVSRLALPKRAPVSPYADQGEDQAHFVSAASESDSSFPSPSPSASLPSFSSSSPSEVESGGGARGEESVRSREFPAQAPRGFVRLALYVHAKPEITLVLLAEDALRNDGSAQDELFTSNLASLNGLDVHLKEVFAQTPSDQRKHSYSFLCYDRVLRSLQGSKRVLALTTPDILRDSHTHGASTPERDLCRAASLMHSEFRRSPAITEITLRSSTACVYGAQTPAQEVFFQVSPSQRSGMVGPGFADGTYRLPGAARSKLQQHGINLP
ncbi:BLOC-3 complex member HPS4 isoform X1 [Lethenteron reissneri]|uniref:BLOC-3 complex member HPS4 isoform X1 n=1 Tax=Lethenteron reissneri TaxID=7753 RepID=UPI002AB79425|nr:BLOC-3 complex member HPS4 isoform X1 [Lethenteron reissneri]